MARKNYGLSHLAVELRRQLLEEGPVVIDSQGDVLTEDGLMVARIKKLLPWEEAQAGDEETLNPQKKPITVTMGKVLR